MRGLMMGRFQPFHLGHLTLVKQILAQCDQVVIAVTGAQFNYIDKDPFTSAERIEMIYQSLQEEKEVDLSRCFIIPVENQQNNSTWASYLRSILPRFDKIYSGNDYVDLLLADAGFEVVTPNFLDRKLYNATNIRKMILQDKDWQSLVPAATAKVIEQIDGTKRMKTISKSDTKPQEF